MYYASKGADISVPELVLLSIDNSGGIIGGIMRTLLPAMIGSLMTFIFLSSIGRMCKENDKAIYFMLTLMSLVLFVFTDVFFTGIGAKQGPAHVDQHQFCYRSGSYDPVQRRSLEIASDISRQKATRSPHRCRRN